MSCCCAGPDFLWRIDKIEVDNTSVRQIKVMSPFLACCSIGVTHYCVLVSMPEPVCISSYALFLTLPAIDELDACRLWRVGGKVCRFRNLRRSLLKGRQRGWRLVPIQSLPSSCRSAFAAAACQAGSSISAWHCACEKFWQQGWHCTSGTVRACGIGTSGSFWAGRSPKRHMKQGLAKWLQPQLQLPSCHAATVCQLYWHDQRMLG